MNLDPAAKPGRTRRWAALACFLTLISLTGCRRDAADAPSNPQDPPLASSRNGEGTGQSVERSQEGAEGGNTAEAAPRESNSERSASSSSRADAYLPLVGRWVRTDSPYVIEIRAVGGDGQLEAAYFNPRPINVSRALAGKESGELRVFVELRDVNYPGATYTLAYNRAQDLLQGVYFQPALGQSFNVSFARVQTGTSGP